MSANLQSCEILKLSESLKKILGLYGIFTLSQVVFSTGKIAFIFTSLLEIHTYDFHL